MERKEASANAAEHSRNCLLDKQTAIQIASIYTVNQAHNI